MTTKIKSQEDTLLITDKSMLASAEEVLDEHIFRLESRLLGLERGAEVKKSNKKRLNDDDEGDFFPFEDGEIRALFGYDTSPSFEKGIGYIEMAHTSAYKDIYYRAGYRILLRSALDSGCPKAFLGIAHCLRLGIGTDRNISLADDLASRHIEKAKTLGDGGDIEADIAVYYASIKEERLPFSPLESAIEPKYADLQILARGVNADYPHALYLSSKDQGGLGAKELLELASEGGFALASYTLGVIHHRSYGEHLDWVPIAHPKIDTSPSGRRYNYLPDENDPQVIKFKSYSFGERYHRGLCHGGNSPTVKADPAKAKEYYELAIKQGLVEAPTARITELNQLDNGFDIFEGTLLRYHEGEHLPRVAHVPDCVTEIGVQAFYKNNLKKIVFPSSVREISKDAFGVTSLNQVENVPKLVGSGINLRAYKRNLNKARRKTTLRNVSDEVFGYKAPITFLVIGLLVAALAWLGLNLLGLFKLSFSVPSVFYIVFFAVSVFACIVQQSNCSGYQTVLQKLLCLLPGFFAILFCISPIIPPVVTVILVVAGALLAFLSIVYSGIATFPWEVWENPKIISILVAALLALGLFISVASGALPARMPPVTTAILFIILSVASLVSTACRIITDKKSHFRLDVQKRGFWWNIALSPITAIPLFIAVFGGYLPTPLIAILSYFLPVITAVYCAFTAFVKPLVSLSYNAIPKAIAFSGVVILSLVLTAMSYGISLPTRVTEIISLIVYLGASVIVIKRRIEIYNRDSSGKAPFFVYLSILALSTSLYTMLLYGVLTASGVIPVSIVAAIIIVWLFSKKSN